MLKAPALMTLIGSAALLWHAAQKGITTGLPENSMDADPVTDSDELAWLCYDAIIGSEFEQTHGWHINLMPESVLKELPVAGVNVSHSVPMAISVSWFPIQQTCSPPNSAATSRAIASMPPGRTSKV